MDYRSAVKFKWVVSFITIAVIFLAPGPGFATLTIPDDTDGTQTVTIPDYVHLSKRTSDDSSNHFDAASHLYRTSLRVASIDIAPRQGGYEIEASQLFASIRAPPAMIFS